jgi:hypothetical protein
MPNKCRFLFKVLIIALALTILVSPALAQKQACVHLLVGAWYAAQMRVVSGSFHTDWSGSFAIGQTVCQDLSGVGPGREYTVEVSAIWGNTATCSPALPRVEWPGNVTFLSWGTTLDHPCQMASSESLAAKGEEMRKAATTVSPQGQKAAKKAKENAGKLPPPPEPKKE